MAVTGIGGFFFRAKDPKALTEWYQTHLGITHYTEKIWQQEAGPTVFEPFPRNSEYYASDQTWMLNFRVSDLDEITAKLTAAGIEVLTNPDWDEPSIGRFARIHDPEGNPIELWEPLAHSGSEPG